MTTPTLAWERIREFSYSIYREKIKPGLTEADIGKFVVIDVNSGDYEIAERDVEATGALKKRQPDACTYAIRVGYSAPYFLGWHEEPEL